MRDPNEVKLPADVYAALDSLAAEDWDGYWAWPLPHASDARVAALVEWFVAGPEPLRAALQQRVTRAHAGTLATFAVRMAALAVRERSPDRLRLGLEALALAGEADVDDWRDAVRPLFPLRDAAWRIGVDARGEFIRAAQLARSRTAGLLARFVPRQAWLRFVERAALSAGIGPWKVVAAPDGFRYVPTHSASREEQEEFLRRVQRAREASGGG